jgi:hypothetical protein
MHTDAANGSASPPLSSDDLLKLNGFLAIRDQITAVAQQAAQIQPEIYTAAVDYAEQAKRRARLDGAPTDQLDQMDAQIGTLKAVGKLRQELKRLAESATARDRLRA